MADPHRSFQYEAVTPLVSSRTLQSAAAAAGSQTVGSSRLPIRRGSISNGDAQPAVTMTAGRPSTLRRPSASDASRTAGTAPATVSRIPARGLSISGQSEYATDARAAPSTVSRIGGTLKRTSSAAGLAQESELGTTKRQLARALRELEDARHEVDRHASEAASRESALQAQLKEYATRTERLERHRAQLIAKEREANERDTERRTEAEASQVRAQEEVKVLREAVSTLKAEQAELSAAYRDLDHFAKQAKASVDSHAARVAAVEVELEQERRNTAERLAELQRERDRRHAVEAELEREKAHRADVPDAEVIREELHRQVTHLRALEKENGKLQRRVDTYERQHANVEILKEQNKALEKRVHGLDELRAKMAAQEAELKSLQREKSDWSAFLEPGESSSFSSPRKITKTLAAARIENATFREKLDSHRIELQKRDRIVGALEQQCLELQRELDDVHNVVTRAETRARQEENRNRLLVQEVDMLKRHLESYSVEEAVNHAGNFDEQKTARINELEMLLSAHKQEVAELAKQVGHYRGLVERYGGSTTEIVDLEQRERHRGVDTDGHTSNVVVQENLQKQLQQNEALQEELDELRNNNALMEKDLEALETQVEQLERNHGVLGAYNPDTTKVLEFRDSPDRVEHAIRSATLDRLRVENSDLVQRISELEGRASTSVQPVELVPKSSMTTLLADLEAARAAVKQKETMLKRISQAVAEKTEAMRIAISKLLGYQLAFLDSGRIRVTSVYAPSKDRSLAFDPWPGGPMPYKLVSASDEKIMRSNDVRQSINFWLDNRSSLPGFMASLTMTLYEETTRGAAGGVVMG